MNKFSISRECFLYPGIFLISLSVLMFELALTRIFSIIQWNYLAFMIISIAFLGYGASGTFLTVTTSLTEKRKSERLFDLLSRFALIYGLSILFSLFLIKWIPFDLYRLNVDPYQWFYLIAYYLAVALPFFFAGNCISLAITHLPQKVSRLYFYDLTGASLGCLSFLFFTTHMNIVHLIILLAIIGLSAAFLFSLAQGKRLFSVLPLFLIIILSLISFSSYWSLSLPTNPYKELFTFFRYPETEILYQKENSFSQIKVVASPAVKHAPGLSLNFEERIPEQLGILTDDSGLSAITRFDGNWDSVRFTDFLSNALGFHLTENRKRVLVIGAGGGLDILSALYQKSNNIEAIELNPLVIDLMKKEFAHYSGQLYNRPEITVLPGEARSVLKSIDHDFDLIQISLVGSATASTGGFHSISENYLYTVEGMVDFLDHLSPEGIISITRWLLFPPRESVKLTAIALSALEKIGIENPEDHIALIRSWGTITFICSKKPITEEMINIIIAFCQERSFDPIYFPGIQPQQVNQNHRLKKPYFYLAISDLMEHYKKDRIESFYRDYFYNITPATDNSPFFFYFLKWKNIPTIIRDTSYWQPIVEWGNLMVFATLLQGIIFSFFFIFLPLFIKRISPGKGWHLTLLYFAALGLGYMLIEISFIQKFILYLTHPTYATSVIIFSFLFFSGWGSRFSQRCQTNTSYSLKWIILSICLFLVLYQRLIPAIFQNTLHLPLTVRFLLTCSLIAPLAFLMGMPFPLGISLLAERKDRMIPWVWATNNFCSILASVSALVIALSFGFQVVGYLAAGIYLGGLFAIMKVRNLNS